MQSTQTRQAGTQLGQPVLRRLGFPLGPFHQQPFTDPLGMFLGAPAVGGPDLQAGEARGLKTATASAPGHLLLAAVALLLFVAHVVGEVHDRAHALGLTGLRGR